MSKTRHEVVAELLELELAAGPDGNESVWERAQRLTADVLDALDEHADSAGQDEE